ncbi:MAG TPA: zinc ribbon domain-containing protein [Gemmatimonadales bacterium]|nr:zinc ribbon domain-containing protein [Gemmatimonadales bacterium]
MSLEIIAAMVVGLAAVWLILQPLLAPGRPRAAVFEPPDPEETPKGVALAALKEIEFDRETGKLSDEDYAFLKAKYTGAALEALRAEAPEAASGDVEVLIAARVRALRSAATSAPPGAPSCSECGPRPETDAVFCSTCGQRLREGGACAGCGAALGAGSRFCAQCGAGVAA